MLKVIIQDHTLLLCSIVVMFSLVSGCNQEPAAEPAQNLSADNTDNSTGSDQSQELTPDQHNMEATKESTQSDSLSTISSWKEIQDWVAEQKGKPVVIDVWSTFCLPCVKEFPHFVEFHQQYGDRVSCASLNIDFYGSDQDIAAEIQPKVEKFLNLKSASMPGFISSDPDESILKEIETAAIPAALIYDQEGTLVKVFNNDDDEYGPEGFGYEKDIIPYVSALLEGK